MCAGPFVPGGRKAGAGNNLRDECRYFAALWGIMIIEPHRLPFPPLYEAVARGSSTCIEPCRFALAGEHGLIHESQECHLKVG
jgi:hypothetical protein